MNNDKFNMPATEQLSTLILNVIATVIAIPIVLAAFFLNVLIGIPVFVWTVSLFS